MIEIFPKIPAEVCSLIDALVYLFTKANLISHKAPGTSVGAENTPLY